MSQLSLSREPTINTRQSPGLPLRACSISARTSGSIAASPILCSSANTAISIHSNGCFGSVYRQDLGTLGLENQPSCICVHGRVAGQSVHSSCALRIMRRVPMNYYGAKKLADSLRLPSDARNTNSSSITPSDRGCAEDAGTDPLHRASHHSRRIRLSHSGQDTCRPSSCGERGATPVAICSASGLCSTRC
jgi:hypothetical protein